MQELFTGFLSSVALKLWGEEKPKKSIRLLLGTALYLRKDLSGLILLQLAAINQL